MSCCNLPPAPKHNPLIGCNGQPHSLKFLRFLLGEAEKKEQFELCVIYRDEINKRTGVRKLQPHDYWYYFGRCTPYPQQIPVGRLPRMPYMRFETKEECQKFIDSGAKFNVIEIMNGK